MIYSWLRAVQVKMLDTYRPYFRFLVVKFSITCTMISMIFNTKARWLSGVLVMVSIFSGLAPYPASGATASVTISISPASQDVIKGEYFTVDLVINTNVSIRGWQANLDYTPSRLTYEGIFEGNFLSNYAQNHGGTVLPTVTDANLPFSTPTASGGHISNIAYAIMGGEAGGPKGKGVLCTLTFTAKSSGTSSIIPRDIVISDANGASIADSNINVEEGTIRIRETPPAPSYVPTPSATTPISTATTTPSTTPSHTSTPTPSATSTPKSTSTPTPQKTSASKPATAIPSKTSASSPAASTPLKVETPKGIAESPNKPNEVEPSALFDLTGLTDSKGVFFEEYQEEKSTGALVTRLEIKKGTLALSEEGQPLESVNITETTLPEELADDKVVIAALECTPNGAIFSPPIDLVLQYDLSLLPDGLNEKNLVLAYYDEQKETWINLESDVDTESYTITAHISHFTLFAVMLNEASRTNWGILSGIALAGTVIVIGIIIVLMHNSKNKGKKQGKGER